MDKSKTETIELTLSTGDGRVLDEWTTDETLDHDVFAALVAVLSGPSRAKVMAVLDAEDQRILRGGES